MPDNTKDNGRKKKQHYVPQCYLEAWSIIGTHQIHVFDKVARQSRTNNIKDVASENYFYDIDFQKALSKNEIDQIGFSDEKLAEISRQQVIENFFANHVEGELSQILAKLIQRASRLTPKTQKRHFISRLEKWRFSRHLSFQHIRTKATRVSIDGVSNCLQQMLEEMNASQELISSIKTTKDSTKLIHGQMISNKGEITKSTRRFNKLIWILAINDTEKEFLTSDKPISTRAHIYNEYMSMSGLMSEGVEIFYPISPRIMLIMFDRGYHKNIEKLDRHYFIIRDIADVDSYNTLTVLHATRSIFSSLGDFSIIDRILELEPSIFDKPTVSLSWNGKVFYPKQ